MKKPSLGPSIDIDVAQLIKSRLLIQANSGGGKSWTLRRLCEQTFGLVQHIIIDREGEFYTLREKHDYALFGKGGDGPADLKSAPLLARRLLELKLSAIIDISELGTRQAQFVKLFLEALVAAPRALWHPVIVVLDEAHRFVPEKGRGESESTSAVIDLMTLGRKRGFCGVLATQRISKLNKDAAAECVNKLIGRCTLDVDRKRAAEELGIEGKDEVRALRDLEAGEFFAYGPALSKTIEKFSVGKVQTTHPEAGEVAPPPVPPRTKVKKLLEELANLPHEAEQEVKTIAVLKQEIRDLRSTNDVLGRQAMKEESRARKLEDTKVVKELVPLINHRQVQRIEKLATRITKDTNRLDATINFCNQARDRLAQAQQAIVSELDNLKTEIGMRSKQIEKSVVPAVPALTPALRAEAIKMSLQYRPKIGAPPAIGAQRHPPMGAGRKARESNGEANGEGLGKGEVAILTALIQYPDGLFGKQISVITGYVQQSRDTYVSKLVGRGLVVRDQPGHVTAVQPAASTALPMIEALPTGQALQDYWLSRLPKGEEAIFRVVLDAYPQPIQGDVITEATGYVQQSRDTYISKMIGKEIITRVKPGWVRASDTLFE